jgi:hypothetical protein
VRLPVTMKCGGLPFELGSDQGVVGPRLRLATGRTKVGGDSSERSGCPAVERDRLEVGLGLLEVCLPGRPFGIARRDQGPDRELCQRHARDRGLEWQLLNVSESRQEGHGAGVEEADGAPRAHRVESRSASMSRFSSSGSTLGSARQRATSSSARNPRRRKGRSSATGLPERVTTMLSPARTRSTTSPPWFLRSRIVTSLMA